MGKKRELWAKEKERHLSPGKSSCSASVKARRQLPKSRYHLGFRNRCGQEEKKSQGQTRRSKSLAEIRGNSRKSRKRTLAEELLGERVEEIWPPSLFYLDEFTLGLRRVRRGRSLKTCVLCLET